MLKIDKEKCIGCGTCAMLAPENFQMNNENKAEVINQEISDEEIVEQAISACPTQAIVKE